MCIHIYIYICVCVVAAIDACVAVRRYSMDA